MSRPRPRHWLNRGVLGLSTAVAVVFAVALASSCARDEQAAPTESEVAQLELKLLGGMAVEAMKSPFRLVATKRAHLFATDAKAQVVAFVDPITLEPIAGIEVHGMPKAIGLSGNKIFVGNATRQTVEVYDGNKGTLRYSFGAGRVTDPSSLAVDETQGLVFVVDAGTREVKIFDFRGRQVGTISGPGVGVDRLESPIAIMLDPSIGEIYVSDYGGPTTHAAIKIFDYSGNSLGEFSGEGSCGMLGCSGGFSRPQGMALDGQGRIYLADLLLAQVLVIDRATKKVIETYGGRGAGPPELRMPTDVAIVNGEDLYVASYRTGRVEVFRGVVGQP